MIVHQTRRIPRGFSLVELIIVLAIIGLMIALLAPSLSAARAQARASACGSNLRQIFLANTYYAHAHRGALCPGSADFIRNLHRWHGARAEKNESFRPEGGALTPFLGDGYGVRQCPAFHVDRIDSAQGGFERGNGGYGYNNDYLGMRGRLSRSGVLVVEDDRLGIPVDRIRRPAETVMFADAALAADGLIEYSFVHGRWIPAAPKSRGAPSIHFRHRRRAQTAWCDGHVDARRMTFTRVSPYYPTNPADFDIGWFGSSDDNGYFDLQ